MPTRYIVACTLDEFPLSVDEKVHRLIEKPGRYGIQVFVFSISRKTPAGNR